jgi:competence protein ComEC
VPHHGGEDVNVPALLALLHPRVAIVNNGATKGGAAETLAALKTQTDVWQLHKSTAAGPSNTRDELIANIDEGATGFAIELEARADGGFAVVNRRNGFSKDYHR